MLAYFTGGVRVYEIANDPGPKVFPYFCSVLLGFCGIWSCIAAKPEEYKRYLTKREWIRLGLVYADYVLYAVLLWFVGFKYALPVILFTTSTLFSKGSEEKVPVWKRLAYAVAAGVIVYIIYVPLLGVNAPTGLLWKLLR